MSLRVVPPPGSQGRQSGGSGGSKDGPPPENIRIAITAFILIAIPIIAYTLGKDNWGHEIGTHIGFASGVCCVLLGSYILFFSGWFSSPSRILICLMLSLSPWVIK